MRNKSYLGCVLIVAMMGMLQTGCNERSNPSFEETQPVQPSVPATDTSTTAAEKRTGETHVFKITPSPVPEEEHPTTTEPETEPPTEETTVDLLTLPRDYPSYVKEYLFPLYQMEGGLCSFSDSIPNGTQIEDILPMGITGIITEDFDGDGSEEMLVSRIAASASEEHREPVICLDLYRMDGEHIITLADHCDIDYFWLGPLYTRDECSVFKAPDGFRYISYFSHTSQDWDHTSVEGDCIDVKVLQITEHCTFKLCELFIDPGYTSGRGLYYTDSLELGELADARYSACDEIYHKQATDEDFDDLSDYFSPIIEHLCPYGITVTPQEGKMFELAYQKETKLFTLLMGAGSTGKQLTGNTPDWITNP